MPENPTDWRSVHAALFTVLLPVPAFAPALQKWPLFWLVPLLCYAVIVAAHAPLRRTMTWLKAGEITRKGIAFAAGIIVLASAALIAFQITVKPDLAAYRRAMPFEMFGTVAMTAILFPIINASFEEIVYRGVLFDGIESQWSTRFALITTSLLFGIGHLQGYPPGPVGAFLACLYGFAMGALRVYTKGLALPIVAHIFADATIYGILVWSGVA